MEVWRGEYWEWEGEASGSGEGSGRGEGRERSERYCIYNGICIQLQLLGYRYYIPILQGDALTKGWCNVRCQMAGKCVV